ncbi:MAG: UbiA family prenyltransferase [Verrucomicrobiota bacterium]
MKIYVEFDQVLISSSIGSEKILTKINSLRKVLHDLITSLSFSKEKESQAPKEEGTDAANEEIDLHSLPYHEPLIDRLRELRAAGHELILIEPEGLNLREYFESRFQLFERSIPAGKDDLLRVELEREETASVVICYEQRKFQGLSKTIKIISLRKEAHSGHTSVEEELKIPLPKGRHFLDYLKALRPHQWTKNFFVFGPLLASLDWFNLKLWMDSGVAFVCFTCISSAIYLMNDLLDVQMDRCHPEKKFRPIASGVLHPLMALAMSISLLAVSYGFAFSFEPTLGLVLVIYGAAATLYSLYFKFQVILDIVILSCLYLLRLWAGSEASGIPLSLWFLGFVLFGCFSLASLKRYIEQLMWSSKQMGQGTSRTAYQANDAPIIMNLGVTSGLIASLTLALFITRPETASSYQQPELLLLIVPLMIYWVVQLWVTAHRGEAKSDPISEVIRDPKSFLIAILVAAIVITAKYG